jgi:hypothetical protein
MQLICTAVQNGIHRYLILIFCNPDYFLFIEAIFRKIESTAGTPINTIHGTNVIVRINVLTYSGNGAMGCANKKRNNVMEG